MKRESRLYGEALRQAAKPWLEEVGKADRARLGQLLELSRSEKMVLAEVLQKLFPADSLQAALANLTRLRKRINDAAKEQRPDHGLRFQVDSKKKSPPQERAVWFTGPDPRMADMRRMAQASTRTLDRLPALITQQQGFVYSPVVDEKVKQLDFAVLVALQEEFEYVYPEFTGQGQALPLGQDTAFVFEWNGYKGGITCAGKMGPQAMADLTRSVLERFKPRLVCVVGIAGALDSDLRLCDVLVADQAENYLHTAKAVAVGEDDFEFSLGGEAYPATHGCISILRNWQFASVADFQQWQGAGRGELDETAVPEGLRTLVGFSPKIAVGHIATGDIVGTATGFGKRLRTKDRKFAAIEMESAGMLAAVHKHHPSTQTLVLRGISDFADERKTEFDNIGMGQFRKASMRNAFRLLLASLPRLLPHPLQQSSLGFVIPEPKKSAVDQAQQAARQIAALPHAYVPNDGCPVGVGEAASAGELAGRQGRLPAADYILDWIKTGDTPFLAVLGEYGIGKTTTLKHVTRRLSEEREADPSLPVPVFIDLRENYLSYREGSPLPTLEALIEESVRRNWRLEKGSTVSPDDVLQLVREEGAVIIFDGLDEKIVHMDSKMAQGFIRELWRALPLDDAASAGRGKLILSCRSHYFPTIKAQRNLLCGEHREGLRDTDYRACLILPFSTEQIQAYLRGVLGDSQGGHAWEVIRTIHNLEDLSSRPYLLGLITSQIESLEKRRAAGETVTAVTLYDGVVEQWLERDAGKHKFSQAHKRELMECLAADLWRSGLKQWPWSEVERWLEEFYAARPVWQARYAKHDFELLLEDLRTATFIVRPDTSPEDFRFAHTSLQEYFLAAHLARALKEETDKYWDMPIVTRETLDFLGQILRVEASSAALQSLERILGAACLPAACLAFQYWQEAIDHGYPEPQPKYVNLSGANLDGQTIKGRGKDQPLNLRGASLRGVQLNRARIECVDLTDADFTGIEARQALLLQVEAAGARVVNADLAGLHWRGGSVERADSMGTAFDLAEWHNVKGAPAPPRPLRSLCQNRAYTGHRDPVNACAWSPRGTALVTASNDHTFRLWDAATGRELLILRGHVAHVRCCAWNPDGTRLLSGSDDKTLKLWDAATGGELLSLSGHTGSVSCCAWSPDGTRLLSGSYDKMLKLWDAATGRELLSLSGHTAHVRCCAWSPDGTRLLSGSGDNILKLWDVATGRELLSLSGHADPVMCCAWSPDGTRLLSGSWDKTLRLWDAATGSELLSLNNHAGSVMCCAWSPDGMRLLSGSYDKTLKLWDAATGNELLSLSSHAAYVRCCAWSPDGTRCLSGSGDNSLKLWDAATGRELLSLSGHAVHVMCCTWSPDGTRLLSRSGDNMLKLWDAATGRELLSFSGHTDPVMCCAWSPDGTRLLSGSDDKTLRLWDVATGRELLSFTGHASWVMCCAWSPNGAQVLSGSWDNTLKLWDAASGRELLSLSGHADSIRCCAWNPDGTRLLSGSWDNTLKLWDAATGRELLSLSGHVYTVRCCAWSPDGTRLLSGSDDKTLRLWDAATGQELLSLSGHGSRIRCCAWSPDGTRLLSGSWGKTLKLWDAATGRELLNLSGHTAPVLSCAWSPDGMRLLSGSGDNTFKVWDAATGQCLWTGHYLPEHQTAAFNGDNTQILHATPEAWRWLGWEERDAKGRFIRRLPAEVFGPIPGMED
ncbi:MAG: pentapeptide repeat-containing protein [Prosthecobacter sp.]